LASTCETCGVEFFRRKRKRDKLRFCSYQCYWDSLKRLVVLQCQECEKDFVLAKSQAERGDGKFCSIECKSISKRGPHWPPVDRRTLEYRAWAKAVYTKDGFCCVKCGKKGKRGNRLNAHHLFPWADFPSLRYALHNGITLCQKDHIEFHKIHGASGYLNNLGGF